MLKKIIVSFVFMMSLFTHGILAAPVNDVTSYLDEKKALNIIATAYAPGPHDNGKWGNLTYLGTQIRPGVIAVDPKVIPLGTKVYIKFPNGEGMYGIAEDIGGAIKGNRIDIAMWSVSEAFKFGIQKVKVYIIE